MRRPCPLLPLSQPCTPVVSANVDALSAKTASDGACGGGGVAVYRTSGLEQGPERSRVQQQLLSVQCAAKAQHLPWGLAAPGRPSRHHVFRASSASKRGTWRTVQGGQKSGSRGSAISRQAGT